MIGKGLIIKSQIEHGIKFSERQKFTETDPKPATLSGFFYIFYSIFSLDCPEEIIP
jgi:hypothetical protein